MRERAIAIVCDVTDRAAIKALVDGTVDKWGRLDIAVGNACWPRVRRPCGIEKIDLDEYDASLRGNVTNNLYLAQLAVPHMRRQGGGNIMFVSSSSGIAAVEDFPAYGTVKAALNHLTKILAIQLGSLNIRVNAIAPGIVDTSGPSKRTAVRHQGHARSPGRRRRDRPAPARCGWPRPAAATRPARSSWSTAGNR